MSRRISVVISSTALDLPAYRREALEVCTAEGVIPAMVLHAPADKTDAVELAQGLIDQADLYIGIFESITPFTDQSLSKVEYDRALTRDIPLIIFFIGDSQTLAAKELANRKNPRETIYVVETPEKFRAKLIGALRQARYSVKESAQPRSELIPARKMGGGDGKAKDVASQPSKRGGGDVSGKEVVSVTVRRATYKQTWRVFVASPGDVQDERSRMPKVIESLNKTLGKLLPVTVELWRWEADATPAAGEPQALINVELDKADIVLVIFWNRFGTPTSAGTTGTESEVLRSLKRWSEAGQPQVMVYFCQRPARLNRDELEQRLGVLDFRESISSFLLAIEYEEPQEFEWRVRDDLFITISSLWVKRRNR